MDDVMGYGPEVYDVPVRHGTQQRPLAGETNLGGGERVLSVAAGVALAAFGLTRRRALWRALFLGAGGLLANRGRTGRSRLYRRLAVSSERLEHGAGITIERSVTVQRPLDEVYRYWRDVRNLPRFMEHLDAVFEVGRGATHWDFRGPGGVRLEWEAEIIEDRPGELISWRTLPGANVEHAGSVRFMEAPGGRGTEVHLRMRYRPSNGAVGFMVAKALGKLSEEELAMELRRFKQLVEAGEIATVQGQPAGARR